MATVYASPNRSQRNPLAVRAPRPAPRQTRTRGSPTPTLRPQPLRAAPPRPPRQLPGTPRPRRLLSAGASVRKVSVRSGPDDQDAVLSLNASAIYLGQGTGSGLGSLVLADGSLPYLGGAGALCAAAALTVLAFGGWLQRSSAASVREQD